MWTRSISTLVDLVAAIGGAECPICTDPISVVSAALTPCCHLVCTTCVAQLLPRHTARCPLCRQHLGANAYLVWGGGQAHLFLRRAAGLVLRVRRQRP